MPFFLIFLPVGSHILFNIAFFQLVENNSEMELSSQYVFPELTFFLFPSPRYSGLIIRLRNEAYQKSHTWTPHFVGNVFVLCYGKGQRVIFLFSCKFLFFVGWRANSYLAENQSVTCKINSFSLLESDKFIINKFINFHCNR